MLTLSGTPDLISVGELMISPINYIYITQYVGLDTFIVIVMGRNLTPPKGPKFSEANHDKNT